MSARISALNLNKESFSGFEDSGMIKYERFVMDMYYRIQNMGREV